MIVVPVAILGSGDLTSIRCIRIDDSMLQSMKNGVSIRRHKKCFSLDSNCIPYHIQYGVPSSKTGQNLIPFAGLANPLVAVVGCN